MKQLELFSWPYVKEWFRDEYTEQTEYDWGGEYLRTWWGVTIKLPAKVLDFPVVVAYEEFASLKECLEFKDNWIREWYNEQ